MRKETYQRNKIRKRRRTLLSIFILCLIVTGVISLMAYGENEVYRNESEFKKFADYQYEMNHIFDLTGVGRIDYQYGEQISYAVDYPVCEDERVNTFLEEKIEEIKENAAEGITPEDDDIQALIISSVVQKTDNGVISLAIHEKSSVEGDREMVAGTSNIHTYHFYKETGDLIVPEQVFSVDYSDYCSEYFLKYFTDNYTDEDFVEGWKENLLNSPDAFDEYLISESGVTFFFKPGQVLDESFGVVYAGIPMVQAEVFVREKVLKRYIDPSKPMVAITYDDGPGLEAEDRILDCLEKNNAVATFFYLGNRVKGKEDKIKRAVELGCEIGNHTWNHPVLTSESKKSLKKQFNSTNEAIYKACGKYPTVFRPSYGISDSKINKMSKLPVIYWTVDTLDWESRNGKKVYKIVKNQKKLDGKIILMHSLYESTADATELIIPYLKEKGYQLVTVSELIKYKTGKDPVAGKAYR